MNRINIDEKIIKLKKINMKTPLDGSLAKYVLNLKYRILQEMYSDT